MMGQHYVITLQNEDICNQTLKYKAL